MQTFVCPQCGHKSTYDLWIESAHCSQCGYTPPQDVRMHGRRPKKKTGTHQPFLDELLSHWNGTHTPDSAFTLQTPELALAFFQDYQRALGEDPHLGTGDHVRYVRNYHPQKKEIVPFVGAYLLLRRGRRATAAQHLRTLTENSPDFADPWVWLTATTDDPAERIDYLENAVLLEPAHPLARDALAIARGKISLPDGRPEQEVIVAKCLQCGGALRYEPGATEVVCPYCGHQLDLQGINLLEEEATPVSDLQLRRRFQGHTWAEVGRVVHCQSCGAELTMTRHLAKQCAFCGSTSVFVEHNRRNFEQPDGFLPFKINEQEALATIHKAQRSGLQGLKTWLSGKKQKPAKLRGVYLPFWVLDGFVEVRSWTTNKHDPSPPLGGIASISDMVILDNLLFPAVDVPSPSFLKRILPFELSALVPYEARLLANWPAALYHLDVEVAVEDACDLMITLARQRVRTPTVSPLQDFHRTFQVSSVTYQLVLLPVWVTVLQSEDERSLALVNGQSGKVVFGPALHGRPG